MARRRGERLLLVGLVGLALLFVGVLGWYALGGMGAASEAPMPQPKALMLGRWS